MNREEAKKIGLGRHFQQDPLFEAILNDDLSHAKKLLSNGSDINCVSVSSLYRIGLLPLVRSRPMFEILLNHGIQIDDDTLIECIKYVHGASAVYLGYNSKADTHEFGFAKGAGAEIVGWLLALGISANGRKRKQWEQRKTPLMEAVSSWNVDVVQKLLEHNAEIHSQYAPDNWQAIHFAVDSFACSTREYRLGELDIIQRSFQTIVEMLLENGADINAQTAAGETPLMWAAFRGSPYPIHFLMEHGADLLCVDKRGRDASAWAMDSQRGRSGRNKLRKLMSTLKDQYYSIDENTGEILRRSDQRKPKGPSLNECLHG